MSDRRKPYNFTPETKLESLKKYDFTCGRCGKRKRECQPPMLEIHHKLPIAIAIKYFPQALPLITSVENAVPLCVECHKEVHKKLTLDHCKVIAQALLGLLAENE